MDSFYTKQLFDSVINTGRYIMGSNLILGEDYSVPLKMYYSYRYKQNQNLDSAFHFLNKSIDLGLELSDGVDIKWFVTFDSVRNESIIQRFNSQKPTHIDSSLLRCITMLWEKGQSWRTVPEYHLDSLKKIGQLDRFMADAIAMDSANTNELKKIIHRYGWLGYSLVGTNGDTYAWNIVQHSDNDVAFQLFVLNLLRSNVLMHNSNPRNYAYLYDRIRSNLNLPQLYGTQFSKSVYDNKKQEYKIELHPLAEPNEVNIYRSAVKLNPLTDYLQDAKQHLKEENTH